MSETTETMQALRGVWRRRLRVIAATISPELALDRLCILDVEGYPVVCAWNIITADGLPLPPAASAFCTPVARGG